MSLAKKTLPFVGSRPVTPAGGLMPKEQSTIKLSRLLPSPLRRSPLLKSSPATKVCVDFSTNTVWSHYHYGSWTSTINASGCLLQPAGSHHEFPWHPFHSTTTDPVVLRTATSFSLLRPHLILVPGLAHTNVVNVTNSVITPCICVVRTIDDTTFHRARTEIVPVFHPRYTDLE